MVVIYNRFLTFTLALPRAKINWTQITTLFLYHPEKHYGIPSYALTKIELQTVSKLFTTLSFFLKVKKITTAVYHPQTNGKGERYNRTLGAKIESLRFRSPIGLG